MTSMAWLMGCAVAVGVAASAAPASTVRLAPSAARPMEATEAAANGGDAVQRRATLIAAAASGDLAGLRRLLDAGADVDGRDGRGRTAALAAVQNGQVAAARLLIERGADVNLQDEQRDSVFLLAGARGLTDVVRLALAAGADLKSTNRYGGTALIPACHHGHVETVRALLATAIDVDHVNRLGWTALLEAVILGDGGPAYIEIVELLLARGADPNLADRDGATPLTHARNRGQARIVELLLRAGAGDGGRPEHERARPGRAGP